MTDMKSKLNPNKPPTYTTLESYCFPTVLLASVINSQPFHRLNLYHQRFWTYWQVKHKTYGYEPSVTDASKPKKKIYQKCSATIKVYKKTAKLSAVFWSETWTVAELDMTRLGTGEREISSICGLVSERGMWGIRTNEELRQLHKDLDIAADIKKEIRMNRTRSKNT